LYEKNPFFRRVRTDALGLGFSYTLKDPGSYFAFPLISLGTLLEARQIPYRDNFAALTALERARPGFFSLGDLQANRPMPNYLLHESAHAISFARLFSRDQPVSAAFADPENLVRVMLCESYAMTAEYLAACSVEGRAHAWLFSISSYRHRTQKKKAAGELVDELGLEAVAGAVLLAFLCGNFLIDRIDARSLARIGQLAGAPPSNKLQSALNGLMQMSPEFRRDTARLFLTMYGYPRDVKRVLARDPLALLERDTNLVETARDLVRVLAL